MASTRRSKSVPRSERRSEPQSEEAPSEPQSEEPPSEPPSEPQSEEPPSEPRSEKPEAGRRDTCMSKYTLIAYVLWLLMGWTGLHHFYLGRDRQGLLWLTSFGGLFGIGWVRDFWRLGTYVKDANEDQEYMELLRIRFKHSKGPRIFSNWHRILAQMLFGVFYRYLIFAAIPWESTVMSYAPLIMPLGTALGTYMVSNVGRQKSSFALSLIGAYLGEFLMGEPHFLLEEGNSFLVAAVSMVFSTYGWEFRRKKESHSCKKRMALVVMVYAVFCGLCCSFIYFNASVETEDGETIKVRDAIDNFLNSPAWQQIKTAFWVLLADMYESWQTGGFENAWSRFINMADLEGEDHAYAELGLEPEAPFRDVRRRYKELAKEWHPDHHQGEEMKQKAQERFIRYKNAYEILEKIHKRKKKYDKDEEVD